jgi:hypothetical protein
MKNYLNYTNTYGINPFNGLNNLYDDATFEELREGLIDFDLPNRLKEIFDRLQNNYVEKPKLDGTWALKKEGEAYTWIEIPIT